MIFSLLPSFFFSLPGGSTTTSRAASKATTATGPGSKGTTATNTPFYFSINFFYIQHKDSTSVYKTIGQGRTEALPRRSAATTTAYSSTTMEHQPAMNQNCDIHITDASAGHFDPYRHSKLNDSLSSRDLHAQECHLTRRI